MAVLTRPAAFTVLPAAVLDEYADEIERIQGDVYGSLTASAAPIVSARRTSDQTGIVTGVDTTVTWQAVDPDPDGMWDPGSPTLITINTAGLWLFSTQTTWDTNLTAARGSYLALNGTTPSANSIVAHEVTAGSRVLQILVTFRRFAVGDLLRLMVFQNSGANRSLNATQYGGVRLSAAFMGP